MIARTVTLVALLLATPTVRAQEDGKPEKIPLGRMAYAPGDLVATTFLRERTHASGFAGGDALETYRYELLRATLGMRVVEVRRGAPSVVEIELQETLWSRQDGPDAGRRGGGRKRKGKADAPPHYDVRIDRSEDPPLRALRESVKDDEVTVAAAACLVPGSDEATGLGADVLDFGHARSLTEGDVVELAEPLLARLGLDVRDRNLMRALEGGARLVAVNAEGEEPLLIFSIDVRFETTRRARGGVPAAAIAGVVKGRVEISAADRRARKVELTSETLTNQEAEIRKGLRAHRTIETTRLEERHAFSRETRDEPADDPKESSPDGTEGDDA